MPQLGGDLVQPYAKEILENAPGIGPSELPKAVFMPGENDIQDQPRQRKTGPLGKEKENGLNEVREAGPASRGASDVEQESQVDASQPEIQTEPSPASFAEIKPANWQTDDLEPHHRRKTGPLEKKSATGQADYPEINSTTASQPISDDHALYRCLACGKRVIGFNKEDHTQRVHGGRDPGYIKLE